MGQELLKRSEVSDDLKWDLSRLYKTEEDFEKAKEEAKVLVEEFVAKYKGKIDSPAKAVEGLKELEVILPLNSRIGQYASLPQSADLTDGEAAARARNTSGFLAELSTSLSFFDSEVMSLSKEELDEISKEEPKFEAYVRKTKAAKETALTPKEEELLVAISPAIDGFYDAYGQITASDADFGTFEVDGKEYPLSFTLYEDYYMYHNDTKIRRAAYKQFSKTLAKYQNTHASSYYHHVLFEKIEATRRGYDSVIDFLLSEQEVDKELYNRQIDMIMEDFAPVMRKYITHIKEERGLDKMYYADLKLDLDPDFSPKVTIPEAKELVRDSLEVMGEEYQGIVMRAFDESWVDYSNNLGKRSGAFCSSAYGADNPYILLSWNGLLSDVYTLIHELGHAVQGIYAQNNQSYFGYRPSRYMIEVPSTFQELLLSDLLEKKATSKRELRSVEARKISKTYFHNFVTHLLEAAYQREVYRIIDRGESFDAAKLNSIKRSVLEEFWGDAVELEEGCELTWMRQPHYYMGLYPYVYSASLTISTQAYLKLRSGEIEAEDWINYLKLGGMEKPVEAVKVAGVDIETDQALKDTINYLDECVDRMISLTKEMKNE